MYKHYVNYVNLKSHLSFREFVHKHYVLWDNLYPNVEIRSMSKHHLS